MSTQIEMSRKSESYWNVLADGKFHCTVPEGTPGEVKREYETSDGKKGVKNELQAQAITGKITNIDIYDGDYGKQLKISLGDDVVVSLNTETFFGEDFMKKLPNIDIEKDVRLAPYAFEDAETKKQKKGITIYQGDVKIQDYYHKKDGEKWVEANGYPKLPAKSKDWDTEDWKVWFIQARKYLLSEVEKHRLFKAVKSDAAVVSAESSTAYPKNDVNPLDVPF